MNAMFTACNATHPGRYIEFVCNDRSGLVELRHVAFDVFRVVADANEMSAVIAAGDTMFRRDALASTRIGSSWSWHPAGSPGGLTAQTHYEYDTIRVAGHAVSLNQETVAELVKFLRHHDVEYDSSIPTR